MATVDADTVVRLRRVIMRLSRAFNDAATHEGLTPAQASVLLVTAVRGPVALADLAAIEHLNPTMLSRVVGKLDAEGLLRRRPNPADQRAALVEVTDDGATIAKRVSDARTAAVAAVLDRLPPDRAAAVLAALPALEELATGLLEG